MADEVTHADAGAPFKLRRPWVVACLTAITLGIYWFFWYYNVNREMRDFGESRQDPGLAASQPGRSVLAVSLGGLVVVPKLVSLLRTVSRLQAIELLATGQRRPAFGLKVIAVEAVLFPLGASVRSVGGALSLSGFVALIWLTSRLQSRLNAAWRASSAPEVPAADLTRVSLA